jgi:polyisoprenoid-binding protein YceI
VLAAATLIAAALVAAPTDYKIEPGSAEAGFDLKATMHTVHGVTSKVSGHVHAEPQHDGTLALTGRIEIDTATLVTGNSRRDATMHDKTLSVASFPAIVFEPERFTPSADAGPTGGVAGQLSGRITIRGTVKPQTMDATFTPRGRSIMVSGRFNVAWADFGIPDPSFAFIRIEPVVHAHFGVAFDPAP